MSKEGSQSQSGSFADTASSAFKTTTDTVSSAAANLSRAGKEAYSQKTADVKGDGRQLSKEEADRLYEERIEEEYAKREGGA